MVSTKNPREMFQRTDLPVYFVNCHRIAFTEIADRKTPVCAVACVRDIVLALAVTGMHDERMRGDPARNLFLCI